MSAGRSALLLVVVALPGLILGLASLAGLVLGLMPHSEAVWAVGGAVGLLASMPMMMVGAGVWGKWRYLWAFAALPVVFIACFVPMLLLFPPGKDSFFLAVGLAAFVSVAASVWIAARAKASYAT